MSGVKLAPLRKIAWAFLLAAVFEAPASQKWRALIVYTNAVDSAEAYQPLYERFLGIFDEMNDIYEASGMASRAEVAGVIWDKEYEEKNVIQSLYDLTGEWAIDSVGPSNGMEKYAALLEKRGGPRNLNTEISG